MSARHSGQGQYLDMTLYDCGMALLHPQAANYFLNGKRPAGTGNPHPNLVPYDKYPTRTCDIFIASGNNGQFRKLCELVGRPDTGRRSALRQQRRTQRQPRRADRWLWPPPSPIRTATNWRLRLIRNGVPAGPVLPVDQATAAPHTAHREMVTELDWYKGIGTPIKFSRTQGGTRRPPPNFAQHGAEVLAQHGYTEAEIAELQASGVLHVTRRM